MPAALDHAPQVESAHLIPETDVREIVRLVGNVAGLRVGRSAKRKVLMDGLVKMVDADVWSWIISRAADQNSNPAVASFQHNGFDERQIARYIEIMQDRKNTPVEYPELNRLRRSTRHFTRRADQLVSKKEWYGPRNRPMLEELGFEHVMYSVRILDDDGFFSGIMLIRKRGRENFSQREQRIAHIVTGEIDWLHYDENLAGVTARIRPLPPRQRTVLMLLLEGLDLPEIAARLGCQYNTVKDYAKAIYIHFGVHSRAQLFRHFMAGDGGDVGKKV